MLDGSAQSRVSERFSVYEHEWRFLAGYLGEPFLIDECLVYFDGSTVNIAAFPLDRRPPLNGSDLERMVGQLPDPTDVALVHAWGDLDVPHALTIGGAELRLADAGAADSVYEGEYTIDTATFDLADHAEARKALRGVRNKNVTVVARQLGSFESAHYRIIEHWRETHDIGPMASCAASTLPSYCREEHVTVFEARAGERLCGFVVVARPTTDRAVRLLSFSERYAGGRIGDALMFETVDYCIRNDIPVLHCGYGGVPSLTRFKEKWGARSTGPAYRQAMFAVDGVWRARATSYCFYWKLRMLSVPMLEGAAVAQRDGR